MGEIKIVDTDGLWVGNPHGFAFVDPETGTRFSPGVSTKVTYGPKSWIAVQIAAGTLSEAPDPMEVRAPSKGPPKTSLPKAAGKAEG